MIMPEVLVLKRVLHKLNISDALDFVGLYYTAEPGIFLRLVSAQNKRDKI